MRSRTTRHTALIAAVGLLTLAGCDLDQTNPNAPVQEEALSTTEGVVALAVGMQGLYSSSIEDFVVPSALVTDEWGTQSRALISYKVLVTGEGIDPSFLVVTAPFENAYDVVRSANLLIENAGDVGLGPGFEAGVTALAKLYKAMALGSIMLIYDQAPIDVSVDAPVPQPREAVLAEAIGLLESARSDLAGVSGSDLSGFRSQVLGSGFDLASTIDVMLARFYLAAEQYAMAATAAAAVPAGASSVFTYTATTQNPINGLAFQLGYVASLASFVADAEEGDQRPGYWVNLDAATFQGDPDSTLQPLLKYASETEPFPVFVEDEPTLIEAEAAARMGDLDRARELINEVRTDAMASPSDPAANLPALTAADLPTMEAVLAQIAYERRYELYLQGLRWDDLRRLDEAVDAEPVTTFFPYPQGECDTNPEAGC